MTTMSGLSAYERAAAEPGSDPRCVPMRLDGPAPLGDAIRAPVYPERDHNTWAILFHRQRGLLQERACREYLDGLACMKFPENRVPSLGAAARVLRDAVNWDVARVPGLLHEEDFFNLLARRVFPSTDYIRTRDEIDYTPAPDLFHDVFGHMPMITHPEFADVYQRMGQAGIAARGEDRRRLERFYWFTVEFGLIRTPEGIRIYGNGLLSSHAEAQHCLSDEVERLPFDPERMMETEYDVWHFQPRLFVIDSFAQLAEGFDLWARRRGLL
jgi:phenylalanine-4-hydroxylase